MLTIAEPRGVARGLEEGEIHDVLRNDRRRLAIEVLKEEGGEASVRDLAEEVAARETGEAPAPRNKRQSVYVSLHQTHLPKLDDLDIVDYDPDEQQVTLEAGVQEVEVFMEVVPRYGVTWGEFTFGLALLGLAITLAVLVGVPRLSSLHLGALVAGIFVLQLVASAHHVVTTQDQTVLQRIRE